MQKLFIDVSTNNAYTAPRLKVAGSNLLEFRYKTKEPVAIQYLNTARLDLNNEFDDFYTGFDGLSIACSFAVDNNYNHFYNGKTVNAVSGTVSELTISGIASTPRSIGSIRLVKSATESETINYNGVVKVDGNHVFTLADINYEIGPQDFYFSYDVGDKMVVNELTIIKTENTEVDKTDQATGLFIVSVDSFTQVFKDLVEGKPSIPDCNLEFKIVEGSHIIRADAYPTKCVGLLDDDSDVPPAPSYAYYNKVETDAKFYDKTEVDTKLEDYYTETEADAKFYDKTTIDTALATKANDSNVYHKDGVGEYAGLAVVEDGNILVEDTAGNKARVPLENIGNKVNFSTITKFNFKL